MFNSAANYKGIKTMINIQAKYKILSPNLKK